MSLAPVLLNQDRPSKKSFFGQILLKLRVDNFYHRNAEVIKFWSHLQYNLCQVTNFLIEFMDRNYGAIAIISG